MIAAMSFLAAMTRASSGRSMMRGTTSAARMPRITMTTMISISVNPRTVRAPNDSSGQARAAPFRQRVERGPSAVIGPL